MFNYQALLRRVMTYGEDSDDRTGTGTRRLFNTSISFDLRDGFPAVTCKKLYFKSVKAELAGFLEGTESAARMRELGTKIWDANANAESWQSSEHCSGPDDMGRVYGSLWRNFDGVDQLRGLLDTIIRTPFDRRQIVTAWHPNEPRQCLPPCHIFFQTFVSREGSLDLAFYMRSVDLFLGLPFDIASYALLQHIIAQQTDTVPRYLHVNMGDTHIYKNHFKQVEEVMMRNPYSLPTLDLWEGTSIDNFHPDHASLVGYKYHPAVEAPMAV